MAGRKVRIGKREIAAMMRNTILWDAVMVGFCARRQAPAKFRMEP